MKLLNVVFNGWGECWPLGALADNGTDILFEYAPEALRRGVELSPRHLPLRAEGYSGFPRHQLRLPGLVADSLPDGWGMLLMDKLFRKQGRALHSISPLDRLAFVGDRGMGALSYVPPDPLQLSPEDLLLLDLAQAAHTLAQGKDSAILKQLVLLGGVPHGSRPKVLVRLDPASGQVSTLDDPGWGQPWLVKFPAQSEHKEVCAIEHVYAELARNCGLEMPATRHIDLDRRLAAFGVQRFDREDGMRVPVHTLAGLLQVDFHLPSVDYSTFLRATRLMTGDQRQVEAAFRRCVFNVLFNSRDDHAKNFSYRMSRDWHWQLSPCYDLSFNPGPGGEHQMSVMGESRAPGLADLLRLAADTGVPERHARGVIEAMVAQTGLWTDLAHGAPIRTATIKTIGRAIKANRKRLK
ncbi:type II toxin-antitoxin system HipA family toxin [Rugamonas sp. FT82W]|uniref:Type II toxin-antitoxin system HipA family toxin n=1 Tax=Duganella vulcania TaxID=2692166 RepID=A0A845G458_9BURK|nr:type II toxin-antitoxin system HipA family toxin [Duganella vulcania]MYM89104.1 type II toxin-antitoxin system HipA family toxin [Duganella vulcania]